MKSCEIFRRGLTSATILVVALALVPMAAVGHDEREASDGQVGEAIQDGLPAPRQEGRSRNRDGKRADQQAPFALSAMGATPCAGGFAGGLHIVDVRAPASPVFAGCVSDDGYTHETQCVIYRGPDPAYQAREICFSSNAHALTIVDVTDKSAPVQISRTDYAGRGYTHQGWLTEDHAWFLLDDEADETKYGHNTRTYVWDVSRLQGPSVSVVHEGGGRSIV